MSRNSTKDVAKTCCGLVQAINTAPLQKFREYLFCSQIVIFQPSILQNKFEESVRVYSGDAKLTELKKWINEEM